LRLNHTPCSNHFVSGIFDCGFELNSSFFPYHEIESKLVIHVDHQYYKDVMIRYNLIFPEEFLETNDQFNFIFPSLANSKFGIYSVDLDYHTVTCESKEQTSSMFVESSEEVSCVNLCFKVKSFNLPFILRYEIPLWSLCFISLMLYFANASQIALVFVNNILLSISFIFLLTNFRRSKYRANTLNLYELTISSFIVANFLLIINETDKYYGPDNEIINVNA
jgi:hypothetical protein